MKKFEDLLSKRDDEIEAEEYARREDEKNYNASVGYGILGTLGGIIAGFLGGGVLGLIVEIGSCIHNGTEKGSNKFSAIIVISGAIIGGIVGFIVGFSGNRIKH